MNRLIIAFFLAVLGPSCTNDSANANTRDLGLPDSEFSDMAMDVDPSLPDASEDVDASNPPDQSTSPDQPEDQSGDCWFPELDSEITRVQPMTGIVLWESSWNAHAVKTEPGNIALEFAYASPGAISTGPGTYDWRAFDALLDRIASRENQAIIRFHYVWPGRPTEVPQWIKDSATYQETTGTTEGQTTSFPDWSSATLQQFHLDFFEAFAERYDSDPRIAFLQVGFGLWAEYHIYEGPREIGQEFPSHAFQETFLNHLDQHLEDLIWSVSIDAGSSYYSPFSTNQALRDLRFGVFDDSFMHSEHDGYNTDMWNFFDHSARYQRAPHGGEFSYYSAIDQENVLNSDGIHGRTFSEESQEFHITYMIGDGQPEHQSTARIREAGLNTGYAFRVTHFEICEGYSEVHITNEGVAPFYYEAWVELGEERSDASLRGLLPGESRTFRFNSGSPTQNAPGIHLKSERLRPGQRLEFNATLAGSR